MSVSVWSHPLYRWCNTHSLWHHMYCIYGKICTACDISPTVYDITTLYPWHQTIISHLTPFISDSTSTVSLSSHPDYRSYNPHFMYNIVKICRTSFELHMTSLPLFMISHHAMTSHSLYSCHHTQDTCHRIHSSWTVTYSVLIIPHLLYVWHQTPYMWVLYEFYIFYRNSIWHQTHSLWHNNTVFMMSHPLYSWQHTHSIWHHIHYTYDITATVSMTRHLLWLWHHTQYIWHLTWCISGNTTTVLAITLTVSV